MAKSVPSRGKADAKALCGKGKSVEGSRNTRDECSVVLRARNSVGQNKDGEVGRV